MGGGGDKSTGSGDWSGWLTSVLPTPGLMRTHEMMSVELLSLFVWPLSTLRFYDYQYCEIIVIMAQLVTVAQAGSRGSKHTWGAA